MSNTIFMEKDIRLVHLCRQGVFYLKEKSSSITLSWHYVVWVEFLSASSSEALTCRDLVLQYGYIINILTEQGLQIKNTRGHGGTVVTHLPPTSEVGSSNPEPYVGKLEAAYQWSAVYSTKP